MGWVSFNSTNCDSNGNGITDTGNYPQCLVGATSTNYGVTINSNGNFAGYAWSENIGWISFDPAAPYPASPNYAACLDLPGSAQACNGIGNYKAGGWARALSYGGGWDGWIKLRGANYGVEVDKDTGDFSGYAWSDAVIGWINFKGAAYKVKTTLSFNSPPDRPSPADPAETWDNCTFKGKSTPTFHWTYSDPDGDLQGAYEIEIDENSSFTAPKFNHYVGAPGTSYALNLYQDDEDPDNLPSSMQDYELDWDTQYFWQARVWDDKGNRSEWSSMAETFRMPDHAYPYANFDFFPPEPSQNEVVDFDSGDSGSVVFGGMPIVSYLWTITQGAGTFVDSDQNYANPSIKFSQLNNKVKLRVEDSDEFYCEKEKDVTVQLPLPEYKEIPPILWVRKFLAVLVDFFKWF